MTWTKKRRFTTRPVWGALLGSGLLQFALLAQSSPDAEFVQKAAQGGLAEVKLGQLAQEKASNAAVKSFGQRMEMDHSKAGDELKAAAGQSGMTLAATMSAKDQALYDRLSALSGAQFDRAYISAMVKDHKEDIAEFEKEAKGGSDPNIKAFAARTLPTLKEHLTMAESAARQVGGGS